MAACIGFSVIILSSRAMGFCGRRQCTAHTLNAHERAHTHTRFVAISICNQNHTLSVRPRWTWWDDIGWDQITATPQLYCCSIHEQFVCAHFTSLSLSLHAATSTMMVQLKWVYKCGSSSTSPPLPLAHGLRSHNEHECNEGCIWSIIENGIDGDACISMFAHWLHATDRRTDRRRRRPRKKLQQYTHV